MVYLVLAISYEMGNCHKGSDEHCLLSQYRELDEASDRKTRLTGHDEWNHVLLALMSVCPCTFEEQG